MVLVNGYGGGELWWQIVVGGGIWWVNCRTAPEELGGLGTELFGFFLVGSAFSGVSWMNVVLKYL